MSETLELCDIAPTSSAVSQDLEAICERIPPLWDLRNYVAVNPFLGFSGWPVVEAAQHVGDGLDAQVLPALAFYRARWDAGAFGPADLRPAGRRWGSDPARLEAILQGSREIPTRTRRSILTFAEEYDRRHGTDWNEVVIRSAARWFAVHAAGGGKYWPMSESGPGLFASWREAAAVDRSLEFAGLHGFRSWVAEIPTDPAAAIVEMLDRLEISPDERGAYFYRLLGGLYGWASYFRRQTWENKDRDPGAVGDLLAVRVCLDAAVAALAPELPVRTTDSRRTVVEDESVRLVLQEALEDRFVRGLLGKIHEPPAPITARPSIQAVFCIDVRSEPLRRHLEAQSASIETRGFAGFFGVALSWCSGDHNDESARCPVLLKPAIRLAPEESESEGLIRSSLRQVQGAPAASFSFVEVVGLTYGVRLASDSLVAGSPDVPAEATDSFSLAGDGAGRGIGTDDRVALAAGILKNMGFRASFARLVLLCGHEGQSANNPHAAGLDCGACGGHGGAINARVAAALLNDPMVRARLAARGWDIPADTHFLPGVHVTTTDEVRLLDVAHVPSGHQADLDALRQHLDRACSGVRSERAPGLGVEPTSEGLLARWLRRRSRDWSEVRPEWGLARNAAFIASRRGRTRESNLEGRAFLHEYDAAADPDDSILTLILTAPVVVASWINLQYFASTVDNRVFGAGDKALHNRVGSLGVVLGNGGDLRTGLARQSVHAADGSWFHEPLRLQVIVEAPTEKIERVLNAQPSVRELVENGWIRLFALSPDGVALSRRVPGSGWEPVGASMD